MTEHTRDMEGATDLFDMLEAIHTGMLGVKGSDQHPQPMTQFADKDSRELWFITSRQSDLVRAIGQGAMGEFTLVSLSDEFYACMSGPIHQSDDRAKLEELWSPMASAWFEGGSDDPDVVLVHMPLATASLWRNTAGSVKFGLEMARAAVGEHTPDIGEHFVIDFRAAA